MHDLQPGIYTIQFAVTNPERRKAYTVELSGQDSKTIIGMNIRHFLYPSHQNSIGYPCHEGKNQQV